MGIATRQAALLQPLRPENSPAPDHLVDTTQDGVGGPLLSERDISEGFDRLIATNRLFGAELNPTIIKESGKRGLFLFRKLPSRHRMLSLWQDLFGKDRVIYDCQILRVNVAIGHLTLALYRERDRVVPFHPFPTRPGRRFSQQPPKYCVERIKPYSSLP